MKRRIKKKPIIIISSILITIILVLVIIAYINKINSKEYKLEKKGYSKSEINEILKMGEKQINYAIKNNYDRYLIPLSKEKYFIWKNYKDYISYIKDDYKTAKKGYSNVITKVNTMTNYEPYTKTKQTNMKLEYGILVNKHYSLPDKYAPDDIVDMTSQYAYPNNKIRKEVYEAFKEMSKKAKEDNITLIVNSSYRDYETQKQIYEDYSDKNGQEYADKYAARPNFSEHQTGLSIDIFSPGYGMKTFENSPAFTWLSQNSYKYGFILRYPKDKQEITGYSYEAWHYRYLGKDLAQKVYNENITFDEYYAYYLDK